MATSSVGDGGRIDLQRRGLTSIKIPKSGSVRMDRSTGSERELYAEMLLLNRTRHTGEGVVRIRADEPNCADDEH